MITKTKAIVFKKFKYGEDSLICKCFTEEHGLLSFFLKGIYKKGKSSIKKSQFELLNNISVVYNYKPNTNFKFFKEVKVNYIYKDIPFNVYKNAISIFISEILINSIKNEGADKSLFFFLEKSLFVLDSSKKVNNFIIIFLLNLSKYLGFYPNIKSYGNYFSLDNGIFENEKSDNYAVNEFNSIIIKKFLGMNFEQSEEMQIKKETRTEIISILIKYFEAHSHGFKKPKSLDILYEIFES